MILGFSFKLYFFRPHEEWFTQKRTLTNPFSRNEGRHCNRNNPQLGPVRRAMQIGEALTGDWHAATDRAEHSRLAPSSTLHSLYSKHSQFLPLGHPWKDNFAVRAVKLWGQAVGAGLGQARWTLCIDQHYLGFGIELAEGTHRLMLHCSPSPPGFWKLFFMWCLCKLWLQWDFVWIKRKTYWQNSKRGICVCRRAGHPGHLYEQRAWGSHPGHTHGE